MQSELNSRPRSMSAKAPSSRNRPLSGMTTTTIRLPSKNLKTQLITSIYHGKQKSPGRQQRSSKNLLYQGISTQQLARYKKPAASNVNKSKQELYQLNMQLKKEINKLSEELTIVKGKSENKSKKAVSKQKQLEIQFEKEAFWAGTKSHMISGIKFQYEKLKREYSEQTRVLNELKISLLESKIPEYKIYSQAIQKQNKRLAQKLQKLLDSQSQSLQAPQPDRQLSQLLLAESQQNNQILSQKLVQLDIQLRNANQSLKDKDKKIQFLEKLIIEKDNREYHIGRKLKKTEKIKEELEDGVHRRDRRLEEVEREWEQKEKQLNTAHKQQLYKTNQSYITEITTLNQRIKQLEQQNKYLENTVNKLRMSSSAIVNNRSTTANASNLQTVRKNGSPILELKEGRGDKLQQFDSVQSKAMDEEKEDRERERESEKPKERVMQRADHKHSEQSKKMRKVFFNQVQDTGQILRYRLTNSNIDINSIKQHLNPSEQSFVMGTPEQQQWTKKYITTGETIKILKKAPFCLDDREAEQLARYMIEDCHEEYVYHDLKNENLREIAKSILRSVIGEYSLPTEQVKADAMKFMDKYETNLESALRTYYPSGKVSKRKFLDTLNGLGVEVSRDIAEYLLTLASKTAKTLQQIEYGILFAKVNKN